MKKPIFIERLRNSNLSRDEKNFIESALAELSILFDEDFEAGSTLVTKDYKQVQECGKYLSEEAERELETLNTDPYDI